MNTNETNQANPNAQTLDEANANAKKAQRKALFVKVAKRTGIVLGAGVALAGAAFGGVLFARR